MATKTSKTDDPMIGQTLGDYRLVRLLGKGGMSRVYLATDRNLQRDVAVKIITLDKDRASELMKRFKREARAIGKLDSHPNIVTVYRYATENDIHYMAMQLVRGETLTQVLGRLKRKKMFMPYEDVLNVMYQAAAALDYAHKQKIIHRDIKPSNIMIEDETGRVVLMDFGLVMEAGSESTLGTAFGTPRYIAPEQAISSQQAVPQSDIYSLGVILFEMLTGQVPFDEDSAMSLALSHITNPPPSPREIRHDLPEAVADVVLKALEKQPEDRYQTATDMVDALEAAFEGVVSVGRAPAFARSPKGMSDTQALQEMSNGDVWLSSSTDGPSRVSLARSVSGRGKEQSTELKRKVSPHVRRSRKKVRRPVLLAIASVFLVSGLGILLAMTGLVGGDRASGGSAQNRREVIRLIYSDQSLTVFNGSDQTVDLRGLEFVSFGGDQRFITRDFGSTTLGRFGPKQCLHTFIINRKVDAPGVCESKIKEVAYYQKVAENLYWVWDSGSGFQIFQVVLNGEPLATCQVMAGECSFTVARATQPE